MPDAGVDRSDDDGPAWVVSPSGLCRTVRASGRVPCGTWCASGTALGFGRARFASPPRPDTPRALGALNPYKIYLNSLKLNYYSRWKREVGELFRVRKHDAKFFGGFPFVEQHDRCGITTARLIDINLGGTGYDYHDYRTYVARKVANVFTGKGQWVHGTRRRRREFKLVVFCNRRSVWRLGDVHMCLAPTTTTTATTTTTTTTTTKTVTRRRSDGFGRALVAHVQFFVGCNLISVTTDDKVGQATFWKSNLSHWPSPVPYDAGCLVGATDHLYSRGSKKKKEDTRSIWRTTCVVIVAILNERL
ncbi:hypothetical protein EAG_01328 [Camponotus floridanus]|uniref:Uncharacterized protein n=1 Tax=Camponotus floridanus TaxID=104421 RepID=E2ARJ5_CAMFO|nr:hypothetical protein EAG_01328 [Camponotus floridanus]